MRANEFLTEYRNRLFQYVKSLLPTWPDYVLKDWLVPNKGNFSNLSTDAVKNGIMEKVQSAGLTANSKWQLVPNMQFTMDMFEPMTKQRLIGRAGGSSDLGMGIPKDKERHATQAVLAQQQGGVRKEPVLLIKSSKGYELLEGWHRTIQHFHKYPDGYTGPAYVAVEQGQQGVTEGEVVPLGKKHRGDLDSVNSCSKCGGKLEGGTYMGQRIKVCQPCKQVYLPPNSGIDQQGNKIKEQSVAEGKLSVDVPNEDWLQEKIDYAKSKGRNSYGVPYMGSTTASVRGTPPRVRVMRLASLPGEKNEQTNVRKNDLKWLMDYMDRTGKLPPMGSDPSKEYLPYIEVAYNGEAWVNEGNHRIMAAYRLNWQDMPIEIRYFDGGERIATGPMAPGKIGLA